MSIMASPPESSSAAAAVDFFEKSSTTTNSSKSSSTNHRFSRSEEQASASYSDYFQHGTSNLGLSLGSSGNSGDKPFDLRPNFGFDGPIQSPARKPVAVVEAQSVDETIQSVQSVHSFQSVRGVHSFQSVQSVQSETEKVKNIAKYEALKAQSEALKAREEAKSLAKSKIFFAMAAKDHMDQNMDQNLVEKGQNSAEMGQISIEMDQNMDRKRVEKGQNSAEMDQNCTLIGQNIDLIDQSSDQNRANMDQLCPKSVNFGQNENSHLQGAAAKIDHFKAAQSESQNSYFDTETKTNNLASWILMEAEKLADQYNSEEQIAAAQNGLKNNFDDDCSMTSNIIRETISLSQSKNIDLTEKHDEEEISEIAKIILQASPGKSAKYYAQLVLAAILEKEQLFDSTSTNLTQFMPSFLEDSSTNIDAEKSSKMMRRISGISQRHSSPKKSQKTTLMKRIPMGNLTNQNKIETKPTFKNGKMELVNCFPIEANRLTATWILFGNGHQNQTQKQFVTLRNISSNEVRVSLYIRNDKRLEFSFTEESLTSNFEDSDSHKSSSALDITLGPNHKRDICVMFKPFKEGFEESAIASLVIKPHGLPK
jgi:hypothetical protein